MSRLGPKRRGGTTHLWGVMDPSRECAWCQRSFVGRIQSLYCDPECWREAYRARKPARSCPLCGGTFRSRDPRAKFCSMACREASKRRACASCGSLVRPGELAYSAICPQCRINARRAQFLERHRLMAAAKAVLEAIHRAPRPCKGCGITFIPDAPPSLAARQVFHDAACRERHDRHREDVLTKRRRAKLVRRRFRASIYARDGSRCYLCRQPIDQAIAFPDPRSPTLDHVVPYSAGGSDDPSNLRAAHLGCNMDKGDRLPYWWERPA